MKNRHSHSDGFTLIEVLIVVGLIAFIYAVGSFGPGTIGTTAITTKMGRFAADFRTAFDTAVLSGKPHRLGFHLASGDYWLESTESKNFKIGNAKIDKELTPDEEKVLQENFDEEMAEYEDIMGEAIEDIDNDRQITPTSPVLNARERLRPPVWARVTSAEWTQERTLGEELIIKKVRAEHHDRPIDIYETDPNAIAYVYILPSGYLEKAVLHIYYRKQDLEIDEKISGYTVVTQSQEGVIKVIDGYEEVDIENE